MIFSVNRQWLRTDDQGAVLRLLAADGPNPPLCSGALSALLTVALFAPALAAQNTFTESFNNPPDYSNNWVIAGQAGTNTVTYTSGNFRIQAPPVCTSPNGGTGVTLRSRQAFVGDIDASFQLNHSGYGRSTVGLWSANTNQLVIQSILDTDDTAYLNFGSGSNFSEYKYASGPYMDRWITLRILVVASQVNFYADNGGGAQLLQSWPVPASSRPDAYYLTFGAASVCWKSGANDTSYRQITATGTLQNKYVAAPDFSIASNPNGAWSYGSTNTLGGPFTLHNIAQIDYQPGINQPGVDRWTTPTPQGSLGVMHNKTGSAIQASTYTLPVDMLVMHPGWTGQTGIYEVVRWTAPQSGQYAVQGTFAGLDVLTSYAATEVHVLLNSVTELIPITLLRGVGTQAPISLTVPLNSGDTLDFVVGIGNIATGNGNDSTGLKVAITGSPQTTGTILVTTNLQAAPFTLTGPATYNGSGTSFTQANALAGNYSISFGSVACYVTPTSSSQALAAGNTITFSGNYLGLGALTVSVAPPGATSATFSINPPIPGFSATAPASVTRSGLPAGHYRITFNSVPGWTPPAPKDFDITPCGNASVVGTYTQAASSGLINLSVVSNNIGGGFSVTSTNPFVTITCPGSQPISCTNTTLGPIQVPAGTYMVTFKEVAGFVTPLPQRLSASGGGAVAFQGTYRRLVVASFTGFLDHPDANFDICAQTGNLPCVRYVPSEWSVQGRGMTNILDTINNSKEFGSQRNVTMAGFTFYGSNAQGGLDSKYSQPPYRTSPTGEPDHVEAGDWLSNIGISADDRVVVIGHSYGGNRARLFAEQANRILGRPVDLLSTVDPIDWTACDISLLAKLATGPIDPLLCDQIVRTVARSSAKSILSYYQRIGVGQFLVDGQSLDYIGLRGYVVPNSLPANTKEVNANHLQIPSSPAVQTGILNSLLTVAQGPRINSSIDAGSRQSSQVNLSVRLTVMPMEPVGGLRLLSASVNGVSALNLPAVQAVGDIAVDKSQLVQLSFPLSVGPIGSSAGLVLTGENAFGQPVRFSGIRVTLP